MSGRSGIAAGAQESVLCNEDKLVPFWEPALRGSCGKNWPSSSPETRIQKNTEKELYFSPMKSESSAMQYRF
jgi:hypothetical protein